MGGFLAASPRARYSSSAGMWSRWCKTLLRQPAQPPVPPVGDADAVIRRAPSLDAEIVGVVVGMKELHVHGQRAAM